METLMESAAFAEEAEADEAAEAEAACQARTDLAQKARVSL